MTRTSWMNTSPVVRKHHYWRGFRSGAIVGALVVALIVLVVHFV